MSEVGYEGKERYQAKAVAEAYDQRRFTSLKGRLTDRLEKARVLAALERADVDGPLLDIPCGTGRMTEMLLERGYGVTAADISEAMMKHAKQKTAGYGSKVRFVTADIEDLRFEDASFDLILTLRLLHHIPPALHSKVLKQLHRKTRRWVIMTFSNKYTLQNLQRNVRSFFTKFPRYSISPALFRREVTDAGFEIVEYLPLLPVFSESVVVLLKKTR